LAEEVLLYISSLLTQNFRESFQTDHYEWRTFGRTKVTRGTSRPDSLWELLGRQVATITCSSNRKNSGLLSFYTWTLAIIASRLEVWVVKSGITEAMFSAYSKFFNLPWDQMDLSIQTYYSNQTGGLTPLALKSFSYWNIGWEYFSCQNRVQSIWYVQFLILQFKTKNKLRCAFKTLGSLDIHLQETAPFCTGIVLFPTDLVPQFKEDFIMNRHRKDYWWTNDNVYDQKRWEFKIGLRFWFLVL
jgi:hypothetical protein